MKTGIETYSHSSSHGIGDNANFVSFCHRSCSSAPGSPKHLPATKNTIVIIFSFFNLITAKNRRASRQPQ